MSKIFKAFSRGSVLLFFMHCLCFSTNIIFDLHGVLIQTDKSFIFRKTKPASTIFYTISHMKNPGKALFQALDEVPSFNTYNVQACDDSGNPLPAIFCDYLAGTPSDQILDRISETIGISGALWNLAQGIFNPELFAQSISFIEQGVDLAYDCADQGFDLYLLSNIDTETFDILKENNPEFFGLFKGIVISGECHLLKPDPAIYDHLINKFNLKKPECVFLDDQEVNCNAAEKDGISSIHCKKTWHGKPNFKKVRAELDDWLEEQAA